MSWMKVDDKFHSHPKVLELFNGPCPEAAVALWTLAGSWCSDQLTDGFVPVVQVRRLGFDVAAADELVRVRLWLRAEGGFQFHEWTKINPSRERVERERERGRERAAESRRRRGVRPNETRTSGEASAEASGTVQPNGAEVRPNESAGSREVNRDGFEASADATPPDMSARRVRPNAADVRPNIREVHPTRPDPTPYLTNDHTRGVRGLTEHELFNGYRERWQARFPDSVPDGHRWAPQNCPDAPEWGNVLAKVREQARLSGADERRVAEAALDAFYADDFAASAHFPPKLLVSKWAKYAQAVTSGGAEDALRAKLKDLKTARDEAVGRGEVRRVTELEREQELVKAEIRKLKRRIA